VDTTKQHNKLRVRFLESVLNKKHSKNKISFKLYKHQKRRLERLAIKLNVEKVSQHVDTLKNHYYIDKKITDEDFYKYVNTLKEILLLKKEAQEQKNSYGDIKSVNILLGKHKFNVMPISIEGFSALIKNNDVSIALRSSKNKVNPSPLIKVEFRAEFLARVGYLNAVKMINDLITNHLLSIYKIKISEIHLATDIQGYDFNHLDYFKMKTRSRDPKSYEEESPEAKANRYGGLTTFTGFSFGSGNYHLRIYNKTKEISKFKQKSFSKFHLWEHKKNYNEDKTVWRIEVQIRRAKLKKMINSDGNTMDDYYNILRGIPDLWAKAMQDFTMKDFTDEQSFDLLRGKRKLKNGTDKPLTKDAIYKIFHRTPSLPFWDDLKVWNGFIGKEVNTAFMIPKNGHSDYVTNSIKSLYSTMAKHYGSVTRETLVKAFRTANDENLEKKQIGLLEDTFNKQLDWIERVDYFNSSGVLNMPYFKDLESEIFTTVSDCDYLIKDTPFTNKIIKRIEDRQRFNPNTDASINFNDTQYLENLQNKIEAKALF